MAKFVGEILFVIFSIGFTGNLLLIVVLLKQKRSWTSTMTYLFNLTVSDLLFLSTVPFWAYVYSQDMVWSFGQLMCQICGFVPTFNTFSSVFFLTAIAIDRWLAVVHSNDVRAKFRTWRVVKRIVAGIWSFSAILVFYRIPFMQLAPYSGNETDSLNSTSWNHTSSLNTSDANTTSVYTGLKKCMFKIGSEESSQSINGVIEVIKPTIGFLLPVSIIIFSYAKIIYTVKRKTMETSSRTPINRVTTLSTAVIIAFIVCWFPYQILTIYSAICGWWNMCSFNPERFNTIYPYALILAWMNSIMNPILYAFTTPTLRKHFFELFHIPAKLRLKRRPHHQGSVQHRLRYNAIDRHDLETEEVTLTTPLSNGLARCCINGKALNNAKSIIAEVHDINATSPAGTTQL